MDVLHTHYQVLYILLTVGVDCIWSQVKNSKMSSKEKIMIGQAASSGGRRRILIKGKQLLFQTVNIRNKMSSDIANIAL